MNTTGNSVKYALITGGTSGIGYELAKCFAKDGYGLVLLARSEEALREVAGEIKRDFGTDCFTVSKDLMVPGAAKQVYEEVKAKGITIDVLVNDAGQGYWGKYIDTDLDREIDLVHLNVIALMSLTKFYLREMVARNSGKILQLASSLAKAPSPYMAVYAASKAFVYSFTEALIQEVKGTGVSLTALLPGATDTDFFHKSEAEGSVEYKENSLYDPAEVAKAGYEALLAGKDKVVPGAKNKLQGIMGNMMPDKVVAGNMSSHMKQSETSEGKETITHEASSKERARINKETGGKDGDYNHHEAHQHETN